MSNFNQWQLDELPDSKIIITEEVLNRLQFLIGRTSWVPSEHSTTLFGEKINDENIWLFDEVNINEDYINEGTNSQNPLDYAVQVGKKQYEEMKIERKTSDKERREAEKQRQFDLRQQKRREKHKGH